MKRTFLTWIWQGVIFTVLVLAVFGVLTWMDIQVGTAALWVSGITIYWVLTGVVILPWNVYFAADDVLETIRVTEERGGMVPERDKRFALKSHKRAWWLAIGMHLATAAVFFGLASFVGWGDLYYAASAAALGLTLFRPSIRAVEHILSRLKKIQSSAMFPRDDVYELKTRVEKMEHYDERAKDLEETFKERVAALERAYSDRADEMRHDMNRTIKRADAQERALAHMQLAIVDKIDTFDDAVAFRTAWERVVPELSRIFRGE